MFFTGSRALMAGCMRKTLFFYLLRGVIVEWIEDFILNGGDFQYI